MFGRVKGRMRPWVRNVLLTGALVMASPVQSCDNPGEVIGKDKEAHSSVTSGSLIIRYDKGGKERRVDVVQAVYDNCKIGSRWPDCKKAVCPGANAGCAR